MKAKVKIKVTKEEYFDFILENVIKEIQQYGHKRITADRLKSGYHYRKTLSVKKKKHHADIVIETLVYPTDYSSVTTVSNGKTYRISYHLDDSYVYYEEEVLDANQEAATPIPEMAFGFLKKHGLKKRLKSISEIIVYRQVHAENALEAEENEKDEYN